MHFGAENRFVVAPAIEDADNHDGVAEHREGNHDSTLKADRAKTRPDVISRPATMRESTKVLAERHNRFHVARSYFHRACRRNVAMHLNELILGLRREDDAEGQPSPACSPARRARTACAETALEGSAVTASYAVATSSRSQASTA